MWDVPRYRIRAYVRAKRKSMQAKNAQAKRELHIRRATAEIRLADRMGTGATTHSASLLLNELTPKGVMLFSDEAFAPGQRINLTLTDPKLFFVRGRIVGCQTITHDSKVIRVKPIAYRIMVAFEFQNFYEREQVRYHVGEIARTLYPVPEIAGAA